MARSSWREELKTKATTRQPVNTTLPIEMMKCIRAIAKAEKKTINLIIEAMLRHVLKSEK